MLARAKEVDERFKTLASSMEKDQEWKIVPETAKSSPATEATERAQVYLSQLPSSNQIQNMMWATELERLTGKKPAN